MTIRPEDQQEQPRVPTAAELDEWIEARRRDVEARQLWTWADMDRALRELRSRDAEIERLAKAHLAEAIDKSITVDKLQAENASLRERVTEIYREWSIAHWDSLSDEHKQDALEWGAQEGEKIIGEV